MTEQTPLPAAETGAETGGEAAGLEPGQLPGMAAAPAPPEPGTSRFARELLTGNVLLSVLSVVAGLIVGAILIAATNTTVHARAQYFFARPQDTLGAIKDAVWGAYLALFQGGVYNTNAASFSDGIQSLITSIGFAAPLIAAGLGIAVGFRAGLFNIGGQGQILAGGAVAGWIGFQFSLPPVIHLVVAVIGGLIGGAIWAGVVGLLKAQTGAHEVIVTIMLNYVAFDLLDYLLHTPVLQAPGSNDPKSPAEKSSSIFPGLFGSRLNSAFLLVIAVTVLAWWLLNRSSIGFKLRAVGENAHAAQTAGISVARTTVTAMVISGALVGFAGIYQVLAQTPTGFSGDFDAGIGFNAITVALLGRSRPWGVFGAGILFGVFQAGGYTMQAAQGIDIDIVQVVQSVIVLFIAAPPLVRAIFRLPTPGVAPRRRRKKVKAA